jgi:hypothetical protein
MILAQDGLKDVLGTKTRGDALEGELQLVGGAAGVGQQVRA